MERYTRGNAKRLVGAGWHKLINEAFDIIDQYPDARVADVKEKWGTLCIYVDGLPEEAWDKVQDICERSYKICEFCGRRGKTRDTGWIKTLCWRCYIRFRYNINCKCS